MTNKIDTSGYPQEIARLIEKMGGVKAAEDFVGSGHGMFAKIRAGATFTDNYKARIEAALRGQPMAAKKINRPATLMIPSTCPPLLASLIRFKGTRIGAIKALKCSGATFNAILNGAAMTPVHIANAKAAMGRPLIDEPAPEATVPAAPPPPEFVLWDGKSKGTYQVQAHGKSKARKIKNVPQPILDLVAKTGTLTGVANAIGSAIGTVTSLMEGRVPFSEKYQRKVYAATNGLNTTPEAASDYDTYKLDLAIVILKGSQSFDRVNEIAEVLHGMLAWKKNTRDGWLLIYSMRAENAARFKRIAARDASEIACP